jgi:hypothetical protein
VWWAIFLELGAGEWAIWGMLLGFKDECFEVGSWKKGDFFISAEIWQRNIRLKWRFMLVYGPADHSRTGMFLEELVREVGACTTPLVIGVTLT